MAPDSGSLRINSDDALSLAQSAYFFSLSRRGSAVSCFGIRREACVITASLMELVLCRVLLPCDPCRLVWSGQQPPEYLAPLLDGIGTGPLELKNWLTDLLFGSVPSPTLVRLNASLGESTFRLGLTGRRSRGRQLLFPPSRPALEQAARLLKHRLLHDHSAAPQLLILCYLLDATGFWNRFFSREELASVRSRLPKMEHSLAGRILGMIDRMDCTSLPEYFCSF